jgi:hypothetical protein
MTDFRALCAELLAVLKPFVVSCPYNDRPHEPLVSRARTALAQPEPQVPGPTDEELLGIEDLEATWNAQADAFNSWDELGIDEIVWWAQRQALARWGRSAIEPVPVSERLPGPKDCDAEGRCWWWNPTMDPDCPNWWSFESTEYIETEPYWLPHWALPVPKVNNTGKTND